MPFKHLILVILVCLAWSFNFTAGAAGMQHFSPLLYMILRFALILVLLFPFLRKPPPGQWTRLVSVSLLIGALHFTTLFWALGRSGDVSSVALLQHTYIPMAVVLAVFLLGERMGWRSSLATTLAFAGVLFIGFDPLVLNQLDVLAITLLSALFQALGSIYMRGIKGVSVFSFQAWTAIISLPFLLVLSLLLEHDQWSMMQTADQVHWASVVYSAVVASLVGHGLFYFLVQRHPVTTVMPYLLLAPVFAVVFGVSVWGDRPGWRLFLGGFMILMGILIITLRARIKASPVRKNSQVLT